MPAIQHVPWLKYRTKKTPPRTGAGGSGRPIKTTPTIDSIVAQMLSGMTTPAQQRAQARKDVNLAIQDSMRTLRTTQQRQLEALYRERYANQQAEAFVRSQSAGDPAAAAAAWNAAGANSGALNQGFVNSLEGAQTAQLAGAEQGAAALAGSDRAIMPGSAEANALVGKHLGVTLPKPVFDARAASAFASGEYSREKAAAEFKKLAPGLEREMMDIRDKYTQAVTDLLAKKPSAIQEALSGLESGRRSDYATIIQALTLKNTAEGDERAATLAQAKLDADIADDEADNVRAAAKARADAYKAWGLRPDGKTPLPGNYWAADGTVQKVPPGYKVGPNGGLLPAPASRKPTGKTGDKPKGEDFAEVRTSMREEGRLILDLDKPAGFGNIPDWSVKRIQQYLINQVGTDYEGEFGKAKVEAMALDVAKALYAEAQKKKRKKQR